LNKLIPVTDPENLSLQNEGGDFDEDQVKGDKAKKGGSNDIAD